MCTPKTYSQQYNVSNYKLLYINIADIYIYIYIYIYISIKYRIEFYNKIIIIFVHIFILVNLLVTEPK